MRVARGFQAVLVVAFAVPAGAAEPRIGGPVPQQVLDDWQARREACQGVYWKIEVHEIVPAKVLAGLPPNSDSPRPPPAQDLHRRREFETWIDFLGSRVRNEVRGRDLDSADASENLSHTITTFDGQVLVEYNPLLSQRSEGPVVPFRIQSRGAGMAGWEAVQMPCLWSAGFPFSGRNPPQTSNLNPDFVPESLYVSAMENVGDGFIVVLRNHVRPDQPWTYEEYRVDLARQSAITQYSYYSRGRLFNRIDVAWEAEASAWRPDRWTVVIVDQSGDPLISASTKLVEYQCNPNLTADLFHCELPVGSLYLDADSETVFVKSTVGQADVPWELYSIQQATRSARIRWIITATTGIVALGLLIGWWRRRQNVN